MSQARESHNGINGPILEAETEIRGYFSLMRVFLNLEFFLWWIFRSESAILDYSNKTQVSRSFVAKPPCQDLMKNANCKHNINI